MCDRDPKDNMQAVNKRKRQNIPKRDSYLIIENIRILSIIR